MWETNHKSREASLLLAVCAIAGPPGAGSDDRRQLAKGGSKSKRLARYPVLKDRSAGLFCLFSNYWLAMARVVRKTLLLPREIPGWASGNRLTQ